MTFGPPAPPWGPTPEPAPEPAPTRRKVARGAVVALVLALLVLVAGGIVAWRGAAARGDADAELAARQQQLSGARGVLKRAETDLAAARASVASFGASARAATTATARVVELEVRLVDLLSGLQAAGARADFGRYNELIGQLQSASDDLVAAFTDLDAPLQDFSSAIDVLPSARCAGPVGAGITWTKYGRDGLQCARLRVPLDHLQPRGEQIQITIVRRPADDTVAGLGPLVINPGGPGLSAVSFMRDATLLLPPELLRRFDLIAFDPRGVGHSSPVDCADNLDPLFDPDLTAATPSTRDAAVLAVARIVKSCAVRTGKLLDHVDTVSTARDMDRVRAALGVEQLSYLGYSYGTYLGAVYADLFPNRIRAAVLDGAVDPRRATRSSPVTDPGSFDDAIDAALDDCASEPSCAFYSGGDPSTAFDELMTRLTTQPLDVDGHRIGRTLGELAVVSGLYQGVTGWPRLMNALARATEGDGRPLEALADIYTGRRGDGSYNNEIEAHYAINCIDLGPRLDRRDARSRARALSSDPPRFETLTVAFALPCAFWPARPHDPPGPLDAAGAAPILVVGGASDPVTPIEGATALAGALESGTLLRSESSGHTSFARGNQCVDDAVIAYLVDLRVPAAGTTCPGG